MSKITKVSHKSLIEQVLEKFAQTQPVEQTQQAEEHIPFEEFTKTGPQSGSNPGGKFKHEPTGEEWYVKWDRRNKNERIQNEYLAAKLYELAGVKVPQMRTVKMPQGIGIASKMIPNLQSNRDTVSSHKDMAKGFAVDAWLGNWDVVGLDYDNLLHKQDSDEVYRVDTGGAMLYRAQGAEKGHLFGNDPGEINTLRNPSVNPQSAHVFGNLSQEEINQSIQGVLNISDDDIRNTVMAYGPGDEAQKKQLADKLIARKNGLQKYVK